MTLPGKTASRFLLSAARVVLTNEQFSNDYLPDFRGDKADRVVIPQESVEKLRGFLIYNFDISFTDAVKKIFGCKEEDMNSIWGDRSIRRTTIRRDQFVAINSSQNNLSRSVRRIFFSVLSSQINSFRSVVRYLFVQSLMVN
ncbi:unnamed protein product [Rotaria socialis]|uniref:Uncharacterized protein n=1 Tax=Rotaria socialis TaxID=392032 RepID=A0A820UM46_9BILA|nr:unnamed protein product [Rotaria socialis]CAF4487029.1 unnamed protein product [Rotaria socialis]